MEPTNTSTIDGDSINFGFDTALGLFIDIFDKEWPGGLPKVELNSMNDGLNTIQFTQYLKNCLSTADFHKFIENIQNYIVRFDDWNQFSYRKNRPSKILTEIDRSLEGLLFTTRLLNAQIISDKAVNIQILPKLYITNNPQIIRQCVSARSAVQIGNIEALALINSNVIIYGLFPHEVHLQLDFSYTDFLRRTVDLVRQFLLCTWVVKDNSVSNGICLLEDGFGLDNSQIASALPFNYITNCIGGEDDVQFMASEIQAIIDVMYRIFSFAPKGEDDLSYFLHKTNPSILRAFYLLDALRGSPDIGVKISIYCMCFETLFSVDHTNITENLAKRSSCFLSDLSSEIDKIYNDIREAYKLRSSVIHGDFLRDLQISRLPVVALNCDRYLRETIQKIIQDRNLVEIFDLQKTESQKRKFRDFFDKLIQKFSSTSEKEVA